MRVSEFTYQSSRNAYLFGAVGQEPSGRGGDTCHPFGGHLYNSTVALLVSGHEVAWCLPAGLTHKTTMSGDWAGRGISGTWLRLHL